MEPQPNNSSDPPLFDQKASPNRHESSQPVIAGTSIFDSHISSLGSPPSPKVKIEPGLAEQTPALDAAPHPEPIILSSSSTPALETPTQFTTTSRSSQASEDNPSQRSKRSYYLIDHDEDEDVKTYNPAREPLPKKEVNHESFHEAERVASSISAEIIDTIDDQGCMNEDIAYIKDIAKASMSPNYPNGVKIGLRGNSGTGKSSIINSLLGIPNIAPQSDDGGACTSVAQEFHKSRRNQKNACEAEIFFLAPPARLAILKEWFRDVFIFEHSDAEPGDDAFEQFEQASSTAIKGLYSLFCDRDECQSREAVQKFLSGAKSQNDAGMISRLEAWMNEMLESLGAKSGKISIHDTSPELIQHKISRYLAHEESYNSSGCSVPSPWPLVKLVKTYFDSPILSQDIVLVDLPGTSDVNQTRVRASRQYLNEVDYIAVVAKIDRVETDLDTYKFLIDAFRRKRSANVLMIGTNSDSVNMKPTYLNKRISNAEAVDAANLTTIKEQLDMCSLDLQKVTRDLAVARSRRDRDSVEELAEEKDTLELQKASLKSKLSEYCVKMRNISTSRYMRQKYSDQTKDRVPLPMFCVSNAEYTTHAIGYDRKNPPMMSVNATGVPALRAFLYGLPAARKFRVFQHHRKVVLPSLLNNLEMTCSQTKLMRRDELQKLLLSAPAPATDVIPKIFDGFLDGKVVPGFAVIKTKKGAYAEHATKQLHQWTEWSNATHKTFCLHDGNWSTKKVGKHDWNNAMLEPLIRDVEKDIRVWDDASNELLTNLSEKLGATITNLLSQLEDAAGPSRDSMKPFFDELRLKRGLLDTKCQERVEMLEKDLAIIKERITDTGDTKHCYFVRILKKSYEECCTIAGPGAREKRTEVLKNKLSEKVRGPFLELFNHAKTESQKAIKKHAKELTQEAKDIFAGFNMLFMHSFRTDNADTPEAKQRRAMLRDRVPHWRAILTDEIDRRLATCSEYAESG